MDRLTKLQGLRARVEVAIALLKETEEEIDGSYADKARESLTRARDAAGAAERTIAGMAMLEEDARRAREQEITR